MSAAAVSRYLADFAADAAPGAAYGRGAAPDPAAAQQAAEKIEGAYARGFENGRAAARAEFAIELATQRGQFDRQLTADRESWVTGEGERIAESLLTGLGELEARIAETTARILKPFLGAQLRLRAIAELSSTLETMIGTHTGVSLHVSGPEDLLDAIRAHLADKAVAVTYTPGDGCDLRVTIGQATLETRLGDWLAKLDEAAR